MKERTDHLARYLADLPDKKAAIFIADEPLEHRFSYPSSWLWLWGCPSRHAGGQIKEGAYAYEISSELPGSDGSNNRSSKTGARMTG